MYIYVHFCAPLFTSISCFSTQDIPELKWLQALSYDLFKALSKYRADLLRHGTLISTGTLIHQTGISVMTRLTAHMPPLCLLGQPCPTHLPTPQVPAGLGYEQEDIVGVQRSSKCRNLNGFGVQWLKTMDLEQTDGWFWICAIFPGGTTLNPQRKARETITRCQEKYPEACYNQRGSFW